MHIYIARPATVNQFILGLEETKLLSIVFPVFIIEILINKHRLHIVLDMECLVNISFGSTRILGNEVQEDVGD